MKKKWKYGYLIAIALLLMYTLFSIVNAWLLLRPKSYFNHQLTYKEFKVYSDWEIEQDIQQILDEVSHNLQSILNYQEEDAYLIFLCNDADLYEKFALKAGKQGRTQGFNLQPLDYTFVNVSLVKEMKARNTDNYQYNLLEGNLAHIISHEIIHQLIAEKIGYLTARRTASWKLEGYCEYAAAAHRKSKDTNYDFQNRICRFLKGGYEGIPSGRMFYLKAALLTEYYLNYKNRDFQVFSNDTISEKSLYLEMLAAYQHKCL